jgi:hypothetical protein
VATPGDYRKFSVTHNSRLKNSVFAAPQNNDDEAQSETGGHKLMSYTLLAIIGLSPIVMMGVAEWFGQSPAASPRAQAFCRRTFKVAAWMYLGPSVLAVAFVALLLLAVLNRVCGCVY